MNPFFSKAGIVIILIVFIAGGIFAWQYFGVPGEEVKDETADWKTYENEEYGFEVKYPADWMVDEKTYNTMKQLYIVSFSNQQELEGGRVEIDIQTTKASSVLDWAQEAYGSPLEEIRLKEGITGQQFKEEEGIFTALLKDDFLYQFILKQEPRKSEIETTYNQMLSTFRFIGADETADWQTYRNEEYGLEIKYPVDFFFEETSSRINFIENQWRNQLVHYPSIGIEFIETTLTSQQRVDKYGTERSIFDETLPLPECNSEPGGCLYFGVKDIKSISLGDHGISALQFYNSGVSGANDNTLIKDTKNNILINIYRHSSGIGEISKDIYSKMLSNFRFLE